MFSEKEGTEAEVMIRVAGAGKCYQLYEKPFHRMLQSLLRRSQRWGRDFWALRDVSFELRRGETVGVIGRNGAGKSTLLQIIAGTLKATEGTIETTGRIAALLELGSGFNPDFTGRQNVYLNASILGLSRVEIDARIGDILDYAEIGDFVDQPVRSYSTGMVMRLAFAVVVHVDADILIVDEALAVGDAFFMQKCMRYLREFRKRGSMLFVSHDGGAVTGLCDRAVWLDKGTIRKLGPAREVMQAYVEESISVRDGLHGRPVLTRPPLTSRSKRIEKRQGWIDRSVLRNDIEVFPFEPDEAGFGELKACITDAALCDEHGQPVAQVLAGEVVALTIDLRAQAPIDNIIVGFYVKDRLGQLLFGDNTVFSHEGDFSVGEDECFRASFRFQMPRLGNGDYFIAVGVAEGTQEQHVVQHWLHEALRFHAIGGSFTSGLVGFPMLDIQLEHLGDE